MHISNLIELHICYCSTYLHCYELHVGSILFTAILRFPRLFIPRTKISGEYLFRVLSLSNSIIMGGIKISPHHTLFVVF